MYKDELGSNRVEQLNDKSQPSNPPTFLSSRPAPTQPPSQGRNAHEDAQELGSNRVEQLNDKSLSSNPPTFLSSRPAPTPSLPHEGGRKAAFTLAEVLITLGIIGVVAALTLPTLIQNYKKQAVTTQLKKAYTEVFQALRMAEAEHGDHENWDYGKAFSGASAVKFMDTYIAPYLNVIKNCGTGTGCLSGPVYSLDDIKSTIVGDANTTSAKIIVNSGYSVAVTSGGSFVAIRLVLSNKKNDKLVFGKNVFDYSVYINNKKMMSAPALTLDELYTLPISGCGKIGGDSSGMACGSVLLKNGWEIPDEYPVRF